VGWLYLLRDSGVLDVGPQAGGALPLQELASSGAQPLGRMAAAWLPAGFAVGLALTMLARLRARWVASGCALVALAVLALSTAASEAVSRNETFVSHLRPALSRGGLWVAVVLAVIGSLAAAAVVRGRRRDQAAAATGATDRAGSEAA
jgi:hypothetical protein